jgi:putative peptidoglycan lipid II flippase
MSAAYFGMLILLRVPELKVVLDPALARIRRR